MTQFECEAINKIFIEFQNTFIKKNQDYGDSYEEFGMLGIIIRMNDKMSRIKQLIKLGEENRQVKDENLRDSIQDLGVYCGMALLILEQEGK